MHSLLKRRLGSRASYLCRKQRNSAHVPLCSTLYADWVTKIFKQQLDSVPSHPFGLPALFQASQSPDHEAFLVVTKLPGMSFHNRNYLVPRKRANLSRVHGAGLEPVFSWAVPAELDRVRSLGSFRPTKSLERIFFFYTQELMIKRG